MAKYKLLACGSNGSYQLGTGNDTDQNTLVECVFVLDGVQTSILPIKPSKISCGGNHTLVPVSYTHLDVYKRQPLKWSSVGWLLDLNLYLSKMETLGLLLTTLVLCSWELNV